MTRSTFTRRLEEALVREGIKQLDGEIFQEDPHGPRNLGFHMIHKYSEDGDWVLVRVGPGRREVLLQVVGPNRNAFSIHLTTDVKVIFSGVMTIPVEGQVADLCCRVCDLFKEMADRMKSGSEAETLLLDGMLNA